MSEFLKFDNNGQWSLDKAQIIDMKSRKTLANLPVDKELHDPKRGRTKVTGGISPSSSEGYHNIDQQHSPKAKAASRSPMAQKFTKSSELLDQIIETLEKSVYNAGTHPPKGYVPGKKQAKDAHAEYDPKYSFKENRELVRMHHQDHKIHIKDDAHLNSLTRAAAKRGGHQIKE